MRNILHYAPLYYKDYEIDIQKNRQFEFSITYSDAGLGSTTRQTTRQTVQTEARKIVLKYIIDHPNETKAMIAKGICSISENGVKYHINKLLKDGIIKQVGPNKCGHWEVIK